MKNNQLRSPLTTVAAAKKPTNKVEEKAALSNDAPEVCPVCKKPMRPVLANGIPAVVCMNDRVCLPRVDK